MVYMTLIVAMLVLVYKKANNLGYKTAKRRFVMELRELIMAIMITLSGGDPSKVYKHKWSEFLPTTLATSSLFY